MRSRRSLPVAPGAVVLPPTLELARRRLGGRASTDAGAGELVSVPSRDGARVNGAVLCILGDEADVWLGDNAVRRLPRTQLAPAANTGEIDRALTAVAIDARAFAGLYEGQRVRFDRTGGGAEEATLIEKCRYGALLARDGDGSIVAVGFRRVRAAGSEN